MSRYDILYSIGHNFRGTQISQISRICSNLQNLDPRTREKMEGVVSF